MYVKNHPEHEKIHHPEDYVVEGDVGLKDYADFY